MQRRDFLSLASALLPVPEDAYSPPIPIIDTHIHLFDTRRPQGVPWPPKNDPVLFKPALPDRYLRLTEKLGIVGAIEIEASPWLEDNQWVLDLAANNRVIVGTVGDLDPGKPSFRDNLERFREIPLFRGIRYGNLWGRDLGARLNDPGFVSDLKLLAAADLVLDTANPDGPLIEAVVRLTDKVPHLRVVIDHLPSLQPLRTHEPTLRELAERPQVYVKVSAVLRRIKGVVPLDLNAYRPTLDYLWDLFGQDRLLYGSDWPNSDTLGTYEQVLAVVRSYFQGKSRSAAEKFFWKNSVAAYRWVRRDGKQPDPALA